MADMLTELNRHLPQGAPIPAITDRPRKTCPVPGFGRPHVWLTGAFYWPLNGQDRQLYIGEDYVMCGSCGQIEEEK